MWAACLLWEFDDEGTLDLKVSVDENDLLFDENRKRIKDQTASKTIKGNYLKPWEMYYKVFFLGETYDEGKEDI